MHHGAHLLHRATPPRETALTRLTLADVQAFFPQARQFKAGPQETLLAQDEYGNRVGGFRLADTLAASGIRPGVLRRRRRILLGQYEQGIFDLGGLALELYGRGLLAEEVMRRRAAEVNDLRGQVHQVDDQLDGIKSSRAERRQSGRGASITCPSCGARCKSGANFCAECGVPLAIVTEVVEVEQDTIVITDMPEQPTQVIASGADDPQATQAIPMPSESESKS